ncbi:hypothetical protein GCM10009541_39810 [Micromonospora gifhornensis]|uniref:Extracellular repeat, HAF family n=1 Tax=Micromonospora gifhornensis TaxID=84594 RepID=A0ABQ4IDX2_9ACTN|nr:hypothetical protein [Micromonospora gifhornensis]GIJ16097.1 hypothetical protein Vgi01_27810 [Micromonospora gifhornensis]
MPSNEHRPTVISRRSSRFAAALLATAVAVATAVPASAAAARPPFTYQAVDLGFYAHPSLLALNERGQVVGTDAGSRISFIWHAGQGKPLPLPADVQRFSVRDINNAGVVAGSVSDMWGGDQAALWRDGQVTRLAALGNEESVAYSINDSGAVAGYSRAPDWPDSTFLMRRGETIQVQRNNMYHGSPALLNNRGDLAVQYVIENWYQICDCFGGRWRNGVLTPLGTLGGPSWNSPTDINNRGEIVGYSHNADRALRAYLWRDGTIRDLGTLGGSVSEATGINDLGEIVGHADLADGGSHPFIWRRGRMIDLTTLGLRPTDRVVDINSRGQIVGVRDGRAILFVRS